MTAIEFVKMMNKLLASSAFVVFVILSFAPQAQSQLTLNAEFQAYPTGIIPGIRIENQISNKTNVHLRVGVNIFDHRDLGVHGGETGSGFGFTLGASRSIKDSKFSLGIRNDFWFNRVDWFDSTISGMSIGETEIIVLQPTAELTYKISKNNLLIKPSLAFGLEWNVVTDGEPTGEGPIILFGVIIGRNTKS